MSPPANDKQLGKPEGSAGNGRAIAGRRVLPLWGWYSPDVGAFRRCGSDARLGWPLAADDAVQDALMGDLVGVDGVFRQSRIRCLVPGYWLAADAGAFRRCGMLARLGRALLLAAGAGPPSPGAGGGRRGRVIVIAPYGRRIPGVRRWRGAA